MKDEAGTHAVPAPTYRAGGKAAAGRALEVALLALACLGAGEVGSALAWTPGGAVPLWPAAGVALAALMLRGQGLWPGVWIGMFLTQASTAIGEPHSVAALAPYGVAASIATGATVQGLLGAWLVRRFLGAAPALLRTWEVCIFVFLVGGAGCLVSPVWETATLHAAGLMPASDVLQGVTMRWIGNLVGVVLVVPIVLSFAAEPRAVWRARRRSVALTLGLTMVMVALLLVFTRAQEEHRLRVEFNQSAVRGVDLLNERLVRYLEVLQSVRAFFDASTYVSQDEFRQFSKGPLARIPGIQALAWNPQVTHEEREAFESNASEEGHADFRILERDLHGDVVPARPRAVYVPVRYIEPLERNRGALGFDVRSSAVRRSALQAAARTGDPVATARVALLQGDREEAATIVFTPVYRVSIIAPDAAVPTWKLQGFAVGVFRIVELLEASFSGLGLRDMTVTLTDITDSGDEHLAVFTLDSNGQVVTPRAPESPELQKLALSRTIEFAGRDWRLTLSPASGYLFAQRSWVIQGGLAAALFTCVALGALLLIVTGRMYMDRQRSTLLADANAALVNNVAQRERTEQTLQHERKLAEVTLHSIGEAVLRTDSRGHVDFMNAVAERLTGWTASDAHGRKLSTVMRLLDEDTRSPVTDPVLRCFETGEPVTSSGHEVLQTQGGSEHAVEFVATPVRNADGYVFGAALVVNDVSGARERARQAAHEANYDALTGLVNRREFERRLERTVAHARRQGTHHVLCFMDLDHFKTVNDTAGHQAGDHLLRDIAALLGRRVRGRDTVARLGGDEFALILDNCHVDNALAIVQTMIANVCELKFEWHDRTFSVGMSAGLAVIDSGNVDATELVVRADTACYAAKESGRNTVRVHGVDESDRHSANAHVLREKDIRAAIDEDRFRLYAQSVRPTMPVHPPGLVAHEVLLRVEEAEGMVPASEFLPAARRYGLMPEIDRWVIVSALRQQGAARSRAQVLSINISPESLDDAEFIDFIKEQFTTTGVSPDMVCFEISEAAAIDNLSATARVMSDLRKLGCSLALDDFGAGLSAFRYLKALPLDFVKFDGRIIRRLSTDPSERAMVAAMCDVAHVMGIHAVAVGVETPECLRAIQGIGVDYVQGEEVALPVPLDDLLNGKVPASGQGPELPLRAVSGT